MQVKHMVWNEPAGFCTDSCVLMKDRLTTLQCCCAHAFRAQIVYHNIFPEERPEQKSTCTLFMKEIIHEQIKMDGKLPCLDPFKSRCCWFTCTALGFCFRFKNRVSLILSLTIWISSPVRRSVMCWWNGSSTLLCLFEQVKTLHENGEIKNCSEQTVL